MRKLIKLLSLGTLIFSIGACSCKKDSEIKSVLQQSENVFHGSSSVSLSTQEIYEYIRENEGSEVNKEFLKLLLTTVLDLSEGSSNKAVYDFKLVKEFETLMAKSEYKVNSEFNEELFAADLESKLYFVDRVNKPTSGLTFDLGLKYDYSDYIERHLNYTLYMDILKEEYILNVKPKILDDSRTRIITIYSETDLEEMLTLVDDLYEGKYSSLESLVESKRAEEIEELGRQVCDNLGLANPHYTPKEGEECKATLTNSDYDTMLNKFTVCANNMKCAPLDSLNYQVEELSKKEYISEKLVNKDTKDILYEQALTQLFREDVEDYLKNVVTGEDYFLKDPLYNHSQEDSRRHVILTAGGDDAAKYLVTVRVVDSESIKDQSVTVKDRETALVPLLSKVNEASMLSHYLENLNVNMVDPDIKEYYSNLIGKK